MSFRFHLLALPHTATSDEHVHCAYTSKVLKFAKMMTPRGHTIFHYGNEGSEVSPWVAEDIVIFDEATRVGYFGAFDKQRLYAIDWDVNKPYWQAWNEKAIVELRKRVRPGDFILSLAGNCHTAIGMAFPGSWSGTQLTAAFMEFGVGYYGTFSRYRCYESHSHREFMMGRVDHRVADFDTAVVPNYYDVVDFPTRDRVVSNPYYLFMGRMVWSKGYNVAIEVTRDIGAKLIMAGQGDPGDLPRHVEFIGHADKTDRATLMTDAIATFCPTEFREPFGGTAAETQLCGTPAITTDHGAFTETVDYRWRCASHREFVAAALRAARLSQWERNGIRDIAQRRWGFDAVAPQYERWFQRIMDRWGEGYYAKEPVVLEERTSG